MPNTVTMKCMKTKKSFELDDPPVVELKNGRHAYCAKAPWAEEEWKPCYKFAPKPCNDPDEDPPCTESGDNPKYAEYMAEQSKRSRRGG